MYKPSVAPSKISIFIAYVAGLAYWILYFVKGIPTFTGNDWIKEQVFSNILRDSLMDFRLPWRISEDYYHAGFFELIANPEISLTPDFLLLGFLSNNYYFLIHWILFFAAGFFGAVLLAKKYAMSSLPFLFFIIIFNCNGYISSHISEGHIQWAAYFLFPFLFYWLSDIADPSANTCTGAALKISLLMGVMFLNGSFHLVIWCLMLVALVLIYRRDLWRPVGLIVLFAGLIGVARLVPAAMYFPPKSGFLSGYQSIGMLLDSLTFIYLPKNPLHNGGSGYISWHEYSLYIGYIGLIFLLAGSYEYVKAKLRTVPSWWIPSALIMAVLAMGNVYQLIPNSGLPFSTIERVPSRFVVMPFCVLLIVAAVGFTHLEQRYRHYTRLALLLSLSPMLGEIFQNARKWRIQSYEAVVGVNQIPVVTIVESQDQFLRLIVSVSWAISFVATLVAVAWLLRLRKE